MKVVHAKSDEQRRRLNDAVKHILLFRSLEEVGLHTLLAYVIIIIIIIAMAMFMVLSS